MQTRLLGGLAGAILGFLLASPINAMLGLSPTIAAAGCSLAGFAMGCAATVLLDVFTAQTGTDHAE